MAEMSAPIEGSVHAWDILDGNFIDDKGIIKRKDQAYRPSPRECDAIDHLCAEWDYDWEGSTIENCPSHEDRVQAHESVAEPPRPRNLLR